MAKGNKRLIAIARDEDGHFQAARVSDRDETWLLLKSISWGQFYEDICQDYHLTIWEKEDIYNLSDEAWEDYLRNFQTRNQFELVRV